MREMFRARARALLTIAGIAIGIYTLFVLGSIAEHFRASVNAAKQYVRGSVRVFTKTNAAGQNPGVPPELIEQVRRLEEVLAVSPELTLLLDGFDLQSNPLTFLSPKALVTGVEPETARLIHRGFEVIDGRWLDASDGLPDDQRDPELLPHGPGAMASKRIARKRDLRVGGPLTIRHRRWTLVGIYSTPDVPILPDALVPLALLRTRHEAPSVDAARSFLERSGLQLPSDAATTASLSVFAQRFVRDQRGRYYLHVVAVRDPDQADAVARRIQEMAPELAVISPDKLAEEIERAGQLFIVLTLVISVIASVVGSLLIINTMVMSVMERRREIGIRIACGASTAQVAREILAEAAVLGMLGAVFGLAGGLLTVALLNPWIAAQLETGETLFLPTVRLAVAVVIFGCGIGALAGLYPAWRAARTDPAETLREL